MKKSLPSDAEREGFALIQSIQRTDGCAVNRKPMCQNRRMNVFVRFVCAAASGGDTLVGDIKSAADDAEGDGVWKCTGVCVPASGKDGIISSSRFMPYLL